MKGRGIGTALSYFGFLAFVLICLFIAQPKPDLYPLDYAALTSSFSSLLAGLGGFAITVLAVHLGLEALEVHKSSEVKQAAHTAVIRHVSVSLAIASVTCFIGAQMLGEVSAQSSSIVTAKMAAKEEIGGYFKAVGIDEKFSAYLFSEMDDERRTDAFFENGRSIDIAFQAVGEAGDEGMEDQFEKRKEILEKMLTASPRRHFLIALVPAFLSSVLILQSLTFLLVIRFPGNKSIGGLQNLVVLAFGAILLVKLLHTGSYGLAEQSLLTFRLGICVVFIAAAGAYRYWLQRQIRSVTKESISNFTPVIPYAAVLGAVFVLSVYLAATFSRTGPPSSADRITVGLTAVLTAALLVTIQIERPTLSLLEEINSAA